ARVAEGEQLRERERHERERDGARQVAGLECVDERAQRDRRDEYAVQPDPVDEAARENRLRRTARRALHDVRLGGLRSEEHTSELQSRENLVCRLLLEKKKINTNGITDKR